MEQRGALMKILELPFSSRHEKVIQEARIYIKKVTEYVKEQQALEDNTAKKDKTIYVSEQTISALNDAKKSLAKL